MFSEKGVWKRYLIKSKIDICIQMSEVLEKKYKTGI